MSTGGGSRAVRLTTAGGWQLRAAAAIVTVPLGVLQAPAASTGTLRFDPPLDTKRTALTGLAVGTVARIVLLFREAVWSDERFAARAGLSTDLLAFLHGEPTDFPFGGRPIRTSFH